MKYNKMTRRYFLQGMGGVVFGLPVLESLLPRSARAAAPAGPRHYIAIKSYSGQIPADFYPQVSNGNKYSLRDGTSNPSWTQDGTLSLTDALGSTERSVKGNTFKAAPMSEFSNAGFSKLLNGSRYNTYANQILCLRGLDLIQKANHNQGGMLGYVNTANLARLPTSAFSATWDTIDQVISHVAPYSSRSIPSLHFAPNVTDLGEGTSGGNTGDASSMSFWRGSPVNFTRDPYAIFNSILLGGGWNAGTPNPTPTATGTPPNARLLANVSFLDLVLPELRALSRSSRLSTEDRRILDEHATYMNDLQRRLTASAGGSQGGGGIGGGTGNSACTRPTTPVSRNAIESTDVAYVRSLIRDTVDVAVAAIRCGVTDVITLDIASGICQLNGTGNEVVRVHNPNGNNGSGNWHYLAHRLDDPGQFLNTAVRSEWTQLNRFVAEEVFLRTLAGLDAIESGGSTFLDNSIVHWGNELSYNHLSVSMPTLIGGRGGGRIQSGRYIDYSDWSQVFFAQRGGSIVQGLNYNRLFVTILQLMGLSASEYQKSGITGYGEPKIMGGWENDSSELVPNTFNTSLNGTVLPGLLT